MKTTPCELNGAATSLVAVSAQHFAHEVIQNGQMTLVRVSTTSQLADIFTKPLHFPQYLACVAGILGKKVVST
jgi:hypothetical protein